MSGVYYVDSHMHCGVQKVEQPIKRIAEMCRAANVKTCCLFAPVEDIYDRYNFNFYDSPDWIECRKKANNYLLNVSKTSQREHGITVYPYLFVWNDYDINWNDGEFRGIKWHRHSNEPKYDYETPKCEAFLQKVYKNKLQIVYEEELKNTIMFAKRLNGRTILIIPHLGMLNGGYEALKREKVWDIPWVYADVALASPWEMKDFVKNYGSNKLLWGSDWPFGNPSRHVTKIKGCKFSESDMKKICHENIERLLKNQVTNK